MASAAPTSTMTRRASQRSRPTRSCAASTRCARRSAATAMLVDGRRQRVQIVAEAGHRRLQLDERRVGRGQLERPSSAAGRRGPAARRGPARGRRRCCRRSSAADAPVAGDEPLDALDHAGDAIGEAGQPLGCLGELVLRRRAELLDRDLRRGERSPGRRRCRSRRRGRTRRDRSSSRRSGRPRRRRAPPSRRRRRVRRGTSCPTRCTSTSPTMTATATAASPTTSRREGRKRSVGDTERTALQSRSVASEP